MFSPAGFPFLHRHARVPSVKYMLYLASPGPTHPRVPRQCSGVVLSDSGYPEAPTPRLAAAMLRGPRWADPAPLGTPGGSGVRPEAFPR